MARFKTVWSRSGEERVPYTPEEEAEAVAWEAGALERERAGMVCSPFQARAALLDAGLLDEVEALIADPSTDRLTVIAWERASEFRRFSPTLLTLAGALGLTDAQVDDLFRYAVTVQA